MKKMTKFLTVLFLLTTIFVSCTDTKEEPKIEPTLINTTEAYFLGDVLGTGTADYAMMFLAGDFRFEDVTEGGETYTTILGTGEVITMDLLFSAPSNEGLFPKPGEYKIMNVMDSIGEGIIVAGEEMKGSPMGMYIDYLENDSLKDTKYVVGGTVNIAGNETEANIKFNLILDNDSTVEYIYQGPFEIFDVSALEAPKKFNKINK